MDALKKAHRPCVPFYRSLIANKASRIGVLFERFPCTWQEKTRSENLSSDSLINDFRGSSQARVILSREGMLTCAIESIQVTAPTRIVQA